MSNPKTIRKEKKYPFCWPQDKLFITLTELHTAVAVKTAQVIPIVLVHRCSPANASYTKLAVEVVSKLVSAIYEAEGLFCVKLYHGQQKYYLQLSANQQELETAVPTSYG